MSHATVSSSQLIIPFGNSNKNEGKHGNNPASHNSLTKQMGKGYNPLLHKFMYKDSDNNNLVP